MFDFAFTTNTISKQIKTSDFRRFDELRTHNIDICVERALEISKVGFDKSLIINKQESGNKTIFSLDCLPSLLVLRKASQNISRLTFVKQSNRDDIISDLRQLFSENVKSRIYKLDIKSFYENVDVQALIERLRLDKGVSRPTHRLLSNFFDILHSNKIEGLPRGFSLSAVLSELYMREFDNIILNCEGVYYYNRYVDDIIIITNSVERKNEFEIFIEKQLPRGLELNKSPKKYQITTPVSRGNSQNVLYKLNYLGYLFTVLKGDKASGRTVNIDISSNKSKKMKTKCAKASLEFLKTNDFSLLEKRIRFITSNYMLYDKEKQDIKLSGIYYNYPMVDIGSSQQLFKLDKFLKDLFTGNQTKLSIQLKASLSKSQRAKILGYRFSNGFKYKIKYKYSIKQIYQIVRCWKHE